MPRLVDAFGTRDHGRSHLTLRAPAGTYTIRIQEVSAPSKTPVPWRYGNQRSARAAWLDGRQFEFVSSGVLELVVEGLGMGYSGGYRIRDSATMTLDERLPRVFRRIEVHRLEAEHLTQERERAAADALDGPRRDELVAHLDFAERRLDAADPLGNPDLLLPRVQAPKPDDLKPYLDGWSPHGPDEGRW